MNPRGKWTSASNAYADSVCQGRHLAQVGLKEPAPSADAVAGTDIHAALAGWTNPANLPFARRELFDECREIEKKVVIDYFGEQPPVPIRVIREAQDGSNRLWVRFAKDGQQYEHSGQTDVIYRSGTRALIIEYKTGANEVAESPTNLQLRDQAVLVYGNHTLLEEIATAVVQPLVSRESQICVYDRDSLVRARDEMYERVVQSNTPGRTRTPGQKQCAFCLARVNGTCVEYQVWAAKITPPQMLTVLDVPMANWSPEQRALAANALSPAYKFLDDLKDFLKAGLESDPGFVPGFHLKPGAKRESINDPQKCFERFAVVGGTLEQFMEAVTVAKGKLKEAVARASNLKGKSLDKAMASLTDGIVDVKQNDPSLEKEEL